MILILGAHGLIRGIAERLSIEESRNPELTELSQDVQPGKVLG